MCENLDSESEMTDLCLWTSGSTMSEASDPERSSPPPPPPPPPPYSYQQQPPPAYSSVPAMSCPTKTETTCITQPVPVYESFQDIVPETHSDTTPLIESSAFEDKLVRRGFVRKVSFEWFINRSLLNCVKYGFTVCSGFKPSSEVEGEIPGI